MLPNEPGEPELDSATRISRPNDQRGDQRDSLKQQQYERKQAEKHQPLGATPAPPNPFMGQPPADPIEDRRDRQERDALVATLDLMEIALRLEEHRHETGCYPESLDPLAGIPAVDPWSGEPYRYRRGDGAAPAGLKVDGPAWGACDRSRSVTALDAEPCDLAIPGGTQSGDILRVRGAGLPAMAGRSLIVATGARAKWLGLAEELVGDYVGLPLIGA